jgi:hypothetical protein
LLIALFGYYGFFEKFELRIHRERLNSEVRCNAENCFKNISSAYFDHSVDVKNVAEAVMPVEASTFLQN